MELSEFLEVSTLLDYYKNLLSDKQREYLVNHFEEDLSLSEIAKNNNVSRQAVYDNIKRGIKLLKEYEEKDTEIKQLNSLLENEKKERKEKEKSLTIRKFELLEIKNQEITKLNDNLEELKQELKALQDKYLELELLQEHTQFRLDRAISIQVHRANADRGLKPKKEHHGYLVVYKENSDIIKKFITKNEKKTIISSKSYSVWKYTVQTPYLLELDSQVVKEYIINDLDKKFNLLIYDDFINNNSETKTKEVLAENYIFNFILVDKNNKYWCIKFQSGKELNF